MLFLSNYKTEFAYNKREKVYKIFSLISPAFRVICVALILPVIYVSVYFVIGIGVAFVLSFVFDAIARKNLFTIEYSFVDNVFSINKIDLQGKEEKIICINCKEIREIEIKEQKDGEIDYSFGKDDENNVIIKTDSSDLFVNIDDYMYSLLYAGRTK